MFLTAVCYYLWPDPIVSSSELKEQIALEIGSLGRARGEVANAEPNGDGPSSDLIFHGSISSTRDADLAALGEKVRKMKESSHRVRAYAEYLDRLFAKSPMAAAEWAQTSPESMQGSASAILGLIAIGGSTICDRLRGRSLAGLTGGVVRSRTQPPATKL
jgi:hypothetical protein